MPSKTPQITLHHLNKSRSERLFWLCEELGLPYDVKVWLRKPIRAPSELKTIHPLGKAPVMTDGDLVIAESGAIVDYILNTYSPTPPTYSLHDSYFSHYAEGSLTLFLQMGITFTGSASMAPWYIKPVIDGFVGKVKAGYVDGQIKMHFNFLEDELGKSPTGWFGHKEEPSAADYMLLYPINTVISDPSRVSGLTVGPRLQDWMQRVKSRPAYQRGFERLKEEEKKAKEEKEKVEGGEQTVSGEQAGSGTA